MKKKVPLIQDDRRVKSMRNGYSFFFAERHSSGDLKGMTVAESGKLVGKEWKEMSASEKKVGIHAVSVPCPQLTFV
jgi:hypothetical protein